MKDSNVLLQRLLLSLDEFRKLHDQIAASAVVYFLAAAQRPGITSRELGNLLGMPKASASRNYAILADNVTGGLGLLTTHPNPEDRRERNIEVTSRGRRVVASIVSYLGKE